MNRVRDETASVETTDVVQSSSAGLDRPISTIEFFCVVVFTAEYFLRLIVGDRRMGFATGFLD